VRAVDRFVATLLAMTEERPSLTSQKAAAA